MLKFFMLFSLLAAGPVWGYAKAEISEDSLKGKSAPTVVYYQTEEDFYEAFCSDENNSSPENLLEQSVNTRDWPVHVAEGPGQQGWYIRVAEGPGQSVNTRDWPVHVAAGPGHQGWYIRVAEGPGQGGIFVSSSVQVAGGPGHQGWYIRVAEGPGHQGWYIYADIRPSGPMATEDWPVHTRGPGQMPWRHPLGQQISIEEICNRSAVIAGPTVLITGPTFM